MPHCFSSRHFFIAAGTYCYLGCSLNSFPVENGPSMEENEFWGSAEQPPVYPEDIERDIPAEERISRALLWIIWFMLASYKTDGLKTSWTLGQYQALLHPHKPKMEGLLRSLLEGKLTDFRSNFNRNISYFCSTFVYRMPFYMPSTSHRALSQVALKH